MSASAPSAGSIPSPHWSIKGLVAVGTLIAGAAITFLGGIALWSYQTHQSQRAAEVSKFIDASQQFDRNVTIFMDPFLKGEADSVQRQALRNNIQDQFLALERASNSLDGDEAVGASHYQDTLVKVGMELDRSLPAAKAKGLIQAIANAREASVCVTYNLRAEAGMDVSKADAGYCRPTKPRAISKAQR